MVIDLLSTRDNFHQLRPRAQTTAQISMTKASYLRVVYLLDSSAAAAATNRNVIQQQPTLWTPWPLSEVPHKNSRFIVVTASERRIKKTTAKHIFLQDLCFNKNLPTLWHSYSHKFTLCFPLFTPRTLYIITHTRKYINMFACMQFYVFRSVLDVLIDLFAFAHTSSHSC